MTTANPEHPVEFLDPQPHPGEDRVWFVRSRNGKDLYAVTRESCSCPWWTYNHEPDSPPCRHRKHLLGLLHPKDTP